MCGPTNGSGDTAKAVDVKARTVSAEWFEPKGRHHGIRGDLALIDRALSQGWSVPDHLIAEAFEAIERVFRDEESTKRDRQAAVRLLLRVNEVRLKAIEAAILDQAVEDRPGAVSVLPCGSVVPDTGRVTDAGERGGADHRGGRRETNADKLGGLLTTRARFAGSFAFFSECRSRGRAPSPALLRLEHRRACY